MPHHRCLLDDTSPSADRRDTFRVAAMNLVVSLEHRFDGTPDGAVWTQTAFGYEFWRRDLEVFDRVRVAARVRAVPEVPPGARRADGPAVSFSRLPHYLGPCGYMRCARAIGSILGRTVGVADAVILRVGSPIAARIVSRLHRTGHPYGVVVLGDPHEVFAPNAVRHPLRPFLRRWFVRQLRRQCRRASAVAYVTAQALQRRYPPAPGAFVTHFSDVELPHAAFVAAPRVAKGPQTPIGLTTVGSLSQLYKGSDVLLDAVAMCVGDGLDLQLTLVGDGKHRGELEARAAAGGLAKRVHFTGQLPAGGAVRTVLDRADIFVLPSRTEGLPRAMLEAMARALPCIGSTVGGIPELLDADDLVAPGDARGLAAIIRAVAGDPDRLARMSARNLQRAQEYREEVLLRRRFEFNLELRRRTESWLAGGRRR